MKLLAFLLITIIFSINIVKSDVVCSEDELVKEILEDLADNGKLDCLRESLPPAAAESNDQKQLRLAANWDGDCSFEADTESNYYII
jgi:hypothetical protein